MNKNWMALSFVFGFFGLLLWLATCNPSSALTTDNITASMDLELIKRGEYLVAGPAACSRCHGMPGGVAENTPLAGGKRWDLALGTFYAPNITDDKKTGIGLWSDSDVARAIRHGVNANARIMFPMMEYADINDADLTAIVSYLRTVTPVSHQVPENKWSLLGKIARLFLRKKMPVTDVTDAITPKASIAYGEYLANDVAQCVACHTKRSHITGVFTGDKLAGGTRFSSNKKKHESEVIIVPNITFSKKSGRLYLWSEDQFVARLQSGNGLAGSHMPWAAFKNMTVVDLKAVYGYLQTVEDSDANPG